MRGESRADTFIFTLTSVLSRRGRGGYETFENTLLGRAQEARGTNGPGVPLTSSPWGATGAQRYTTQKRDTLRSRLAYRWLQVEGVFS